MSEPIESLDTILTSLGAYKITVFEPTVDEYYAYYPELKRAKQALEAYITERERLARVEELTELEALPNVYPEKIKGQYTHVQAIYKSAIKDRLTELNKDRSK